MTVYSLLRIWIANKRAIVKPNRDVVIVLNALATEPEEQ